MSITAYGYGEGTYGGTRNYDGLAQDNVPRFLVMALKGATWLDLTCDVRSIKIDRGRSSWVEAFSAGTAEVVLANPAGIYSGFPPPTPAWPDTSVWLQAGGFVTNVPLRIGSLLAGVIEWHFTGTTDAVKDTWPGTVDAIATVSATDGFKQLARHNGGPRPAQGAGEFTGARVTRLAADAGWAGPMTVDSGTVTVQATTLDGVTIDLMRQVGETEWGWLYVGGDGTLRFRQRNAAQTDPRMTTAQYVFTDTDEVRGACYGDATLAANDERIINIANITPPGLALQNYSDAASAAWYGPRTWTRTDLPFANVADAQTLAQLLVTTQARDDQRVDAVVFDGARRANNQAAAHGARITDRIRFVRTFPGSGYQFAADLIVQGRHDDALPAGTDGLLAEWTVTLQTSGVAAFLANGQWDGTGWDNSVWT